jgi:hypothetical protein
MINLYRKKLLTEKIVKSADKVTIKEMLGEENYLERGYVVRDEVWEYPDGYIMECPKQAYNLNDEWIGEADLANRLYKKHGIIHT